MATPLIYNPTSRHPHTHTIIFLHGPFDDASRFSSTLLATATAHSHTLTTAFPSFRLVFPQAPTRAPIGNPKEYPGPLWFDDSLSKRSTLSGPPSEVGNPTIRTLADVLPGLRSLIAQEAAILRERYDKIIVAGISMGGATVSQLLLTLDIPRESGGRLGAVLLFASWSPCPELSLNQIRDLLGSGVAPSNDVVIRNTPILVEHARDDHVVNIEQGRRLRDLLKRFGGDVTWREYDEGRHWFGQPDGLHDAISFIEKRVVGAKKVKERGIRAYILGILHKIF